MSDDRPARRAGSARPPLRRRDRGRAAAAGTSSSSLVRSLTPEECLEPGYYRDPGLDRPRRRRPPRDVAGRGPGPVRAHRRRHLRGPRRRRRRAERRAARRRWRASPWRSRGSRRMPARTRMVEDGTALREPTDEAAWWIRKAAATTTPSTSRGSASGSPSWSPAAPVKAEREGYSVRRRMSKAAGGAGGPTSLHLSR